MATLVKLVTARNLGVRLARVASMGNALTPLMVNTQLIVEQSKSDDIGDLARVVFNAARRIAFTLRRLRDIEASQSMASLGKGRMLDLRLAARPED